MITWAVAWMIVKVGAEGAGLHLFYAIVADVAIAFFVACASKGWPIG